MKKIILSAAILGLLFIASCKNETKVVAGNEEELVVETQSTTLETADLEIAYNEAVVKLEEAKKAGDTEAQKLAEDALNKAKTAWESAKAKAEEISKDVKEEAQETEKKVEQKIDEAKQNARQAVEETKQKANNAKEEAKKEYNSTVDKIKIK